MHCYANTATCAMLHYTPLGANAHSFIYLFLSACEGSATGLSHSLQAVPRLKWRVSGRGEGGSAAAETEEQVRPSLARPGPARPTRRHHLCSLPRAYSDPLFRSQKWRKCQSRSRPGNLHAQTRSFLSWHSSSCGLCKDFPAFHSLPVYVSLSHSFGWLPFGKLPQSSGLFFFLCVCALWRCGSLCEGLCGCILPWFNSSLCICCDKLKPHADICWCECTEDPRRGLNVDRAINLIPLLSDICFTGQ